MLGKIGALGNKAKSIYNYLTVAITLLRSVKDLVQTFEEDDVEDGNKNGEHKKEAVLDTIAVIYSQGDVFVDIPISKNKVLSLAESFIDIIVNFYNAIGVFR